MKVESIYDGSGLANELGYVSEGDYAGWLVARHPDGQWVTLAPIAETVEKHRKKGISVEGQRYINKLRNEIGPGQASPL